MTPKDDRTASLVIFEFIVTGAVVSIVMMLVYLWWPR